MTARLPFRVTCIIPGCRHTKAAEEDSEWICDRHFRPIPRPLRVEYDAAWREADKADKRAADGIEPNLAVYVRVTSAFEACKQAAIEAAGRQA